MSDMPRTKYYLLSITGEPCGNCKGNEPWSHRARIEKEENGTFAQYEIICANCIGILLKDQFTEFFDTLLESIISTEAPITIAEGSDQESSK